MVTPICPLTKIPNSFAVAAPVQPVRGSPSPVIVKAFNRSTTLGALMVMHGAPLTVHVTSPVRSLSSMTVNVALIVPLIFAAWALPAPTTRCAATTKAKYVGILSRSTLLPPITLIHLTDGNRIRKTQVFSHGNCPREIRGIFLARFSPVPAGDPSRQEPSRNLHLESLENSQNFLKISSQFFSS